MGEYRFCRNESCDVVYFDETHNVTFGAGDLKVPVFQKSADPNRPVCYCFDHTVRSIQAEVAESGTVSGSAAIDRMIAIASSGVRLVCSPVLGLRMRT